MDRDKLGSKPEAYDCDLDFFVAHFLNYIFRLSHNWRTRLSTQARCFYAMDSAGLRPLGAQTVNGILGPYERSKGEIFQVLP